MKFQFISSTCYDFLNRWVCKFFSVLLIESNQLSSTESNESSWTFFLVTLIELNPLTSTESNASSWTFLVFITRWKRYFFAGGRAGHERTPSETPQVYFFAGSQGIFKKRFWKIWIAFVRNKGWSVDNVFLVLGRVVVGTSDERLRRTFLQVWLQVDSWHVVRRVEGANGKVSVGIILSALYEMILHSIESDAVALVVRTRDKHLFFNKPNNLR